MKQEIGYTGSSKYHSKRALRILVAAALVGTAAFGAAMEAQASVNYGSNKYTSSTKGSDDKYVTTTYTDNTMPGIHNVFGTNNTVDESTPTNTSINIFGDSNSVKGENSNAFGGGVHVYGERSNAVGEMSTVTGNLSNAYGTWLTVNGNYSNAFGSSSTKSYDTGLRLYGDYGLLLGTNSTIGTTSAHINNAIGIGRKVSVTGAQGIAIGSGTDSVSGASASGPNAIAIGTGTTASNTDAIAQGDGATASGSQSVAIGGKTDWGYTENGTYNGTASSGAYSTKATNSYATAIGSGAVAAADCSTAIGHFATVLGQYTDKDGTTKITVNKGTAIGGHAFVAGSYGTALGLQAEVLKGANNSTAIGSYAKVDQGITGAVALGYQSEATKNNTISVGTSSNTRQIVNVKAGTDTTDAANVGQLTKVAAASNNALKLDSSEKDANGATTYTLSVSTDGKVADGDTGVLKGDTVYDYLHQDAVVLGSSTESDTNRAGERSVVIGAGTRAGYHAVALGGTENNKMNIDWGLGKEGQTQSYVNTGTTVNPTTAANNAVAIGSATEADGRCSIAIGHFATVYATPKDDGTKNENDVAHSVALGGHSFVNAADSLALGYETRVRSKNSVALGSGSLVKENEENVVSVGNDSTKRKIIHVANGVADNDAVNMSQLKNIQTNVQDTYFSKDDYKTNTHLNNSWTLYTKFNSDGTSETGDINNDHTVGQNIEVLAAATYAEQNARIWADRSQDEVIVNGDNGALKLDENGNLVKQTATLDKENGWKKTYDTKAVSKVTLGSTDEKNQVTISADAGEGGKGILTISDGTEDGKKVTIDTGTGKISGVEKGEISATSTDAVNGSQLNEIKNSVTNLSEGAVQYDQKDGKWDTTKVTLKGEGGTTITNLKDGALNDSSKDAVTGKQLYAEQTAREAAITNEARTRENADTALSNRIGTISEGSYRYINKDADVSTNLINLDKEIQSAAGSLEKGLDFAADTGTATNKLGSKVSVTGDSKNISTVLTQDKEGNTTVKVSLSDTPNFTSVTTTGDATFGGKLSVTGAADFKDIVTLEKDGKVEGGSKEAVNGGQLYNEQAAREAADANLAANLKNAKSIDTNKWAAALGTGAIVKNETNLVNGGTVYDALSKLRDTNGNYLIEKTGDNTVSVAYHDEKITTVNMQSENGTDRVVTGVATDPGDGTSAANVAFVDNQIDNLNHRLNRNINRAAAGVSALAALHPLDYDPADRLNFAVGYGHYKDANAAAVGAFYYVNPNVMFSMGASMGNGDAAVNAGISFKVGPGSAYAGVSKVELAQDNAAMKQRIAELQKHDDATTKELADLKKQVAAMAKALGLAEKDADADVTLSEDVQKSVTAKA